MASRKISLALKLLFGGVLGLLLISFSVLIIANIKSKNNLKEILADPPKCGKNLYFQYIKERKSPM